MPIYQGSEILFTQDDLDYNVIRERLGDGSGPFNIEIGLSLTGEFTDIKRSRFIISSPEYTDAMDVNWPNSFIDELNNFFEVSFRNLFNNWNMNDTEWLPKFSYYDVGDNYYAVQVESSSSLAFSQKDFNLVVQPAYSGTLNLAKIIGLPTGDFPNYDSPSEAGGGIKVVINHRRGDNVRVVMIPREGAVMSDPGDNSTAYIDEEVNEFKVCLVEPIPFFVFDPYFNSCNPGV